MNMHWEPQRLALPDLPVGMRWEKVLDTQGDMVETQADPLAKSITVRDAASRFWKAQEIRSGKERKEKKSESVTAF